MKLESPVKPVDSIASVTDLLRVLPAKGGRYLYRGESRDYGALLPKLLRPNTFNRLSPRHLEEDPVKLQRSLLARFKRYASHYHLGGEHRSFVGGEPTQNEWLCVAQHHGLPTLLLDWTIDPLAALYFAVSSDSENPGRFWCMTLVDKSRRLRQMVYLEDDEVSPKVLAQRSKSPLVVVPTVFTRRIEAQLGRFTYSGHAVRPEEAALERYAGPRRPWKSLVCFKVPGDQKRALQDELERCGIHEGRLFPDLDGYASYLASGGL